MMANHKKVSAQYFAVDFFASMRLILGKDRVAARFFHSHSPDC